MSDLGNQLREYADQLRLPDWVIDPVKSAGPDLLISAADRLEQDEKAHALVTQVNDLLGHKVKLDSHHITTPEQAMVELMDEILLLRKQLHGQAKRIGKFQLEQREARRLAEFVDQLATTENPLDDDHLSAWIEAAKELSEQN